MTNSFTCISCQVVFGTPEEQRTHHRTEWHRYNLKRKCAGLPPVTAENFATRTLDQNKMDGVKTKTETFFCVCCKKSFSSDNAYQNHMQSRKHKEVNIKHTAMMEASEAGSVVESTVASTTPRLTERYWIKKFEDARTEEELTMIVEEKAKAARVLEIEECLFCNHKSENLEDNLQHMSVSHSFFVPDLEYVIDLEGLIKYIGEKVSMHNMCLYCNGKGRNFYSLESTRKHMIDKGHCRLLWDDEADMNILEFYDYSSSYPDAMEVEDEDAPIHESIFVDSDGTMILPSGTQLGNRMYKKYYKQRLPAEENRESVLINKLMGQYRALGWKGNDELSVVHKKALEIKDRRFRNEMMHLGVKANKLQKHFRVQILQ
ncbi:hypothetical protein ROZALSC1DRAFT_12959 [Rozella allomycis CSF55]|uniref:C2H2-type domain-containing protein n=1 Tax=Rozella allomycis (strain CSF55) TaxID=988480 RepID=A0A4P9YKT7_ROZAC|nr:hypothetical protein ROZALSC1DRAFT_12959 [Rozella allomycis CSF55]